MNDPVAGLVRGKSGLEGRFRKRAGFCQDRRDGVLGTDLVIGCGKIEDVIDVRRQCVKPRNNAPVASLRRSVLEAAISSKRGPKKVQDQQSLVSGVGGRYAQALFDIAEDDGIIDHVAADLESIRGLMDQSPDFARLVRSPVFSTEDQLKGMDAVLLQGKAYQATRNFAGVLIKNRRLFVISDVIENFRKLVAHHKNEVSAEVTSAKALTPQQADDVRQTLKAHAGQDVRITAKVDPSILGGLVVKIGSRMIDSSIKTKLANLKFAMKEVR